LVVVAAIAVIGVGCGDDDDNGSGEDGGAAAETSTTQQAETVAADDLQLTATKASEPHTISVVLGARTGPWEEAEKRGAEKAGEELGVNVEVDAPPEWDGTQQAEVVNGVLPTNPDFMVVQPADAEVLIPPLEAIDQAGIKMVTIDTVIGDGNYQSGERGSFPLTFIGSNNLEGGKLGCETLVKAIGGKGKVYIQDNTPGASSTVDRTKGCQSVLERYPDIEFVGKQFGAEDAAKAQAQTETIMQKHPDLAGIFANAGFVSEGAANAVRTQGKEDEVKVVMFDATPSNVELLKGGTAYAIIAQRPELMGELGVKLAVEYLEGKESLPTVVDTGMVAITQDNMDKVDVDALTY
jgi:ribose transport system substrate-binding protein